MHEHVCGGSIVSHICTEVCLSNSPFPTGYVSIQHPISPGGIDELLELELLELDELELDDELELLDDELDDELLLELLDDELELEDELELDELLLELDEELLELELLELLELGLPQQQNHQAITHRLFSIRSHLDRTSESVRNTFHLGKSSILLCQPPFHKKRLPDPTQSR